MQLYQRKKKIPVVLYNLFFLDIYMVCLHLTSFQERHPCKGPVPCLGMFLCILLSIFRYLRLLIVSRKRNVNLLMKVSPTNQRIEKQVLEKRRKELVTSLHLLGDYEGLLTPPQSVISVLYGLLVSWKNKLIYLFCCFIIPSPPTTVGSAYLYLFQSVMTLIVCQSTPFFLLPDCYISSSSCRILWSE